MEIVTFKEVLFQSTRPIRGATTAGPGRYPVPSRFQSTRPIRGATPSNTDSIVISGFQSTRPIRGATARNSSAYSGTRFQSTRPIRGATCFPGFPRIRLPISIHAPHTGRDPLAAHFRTRSSNFNPRAPYGARHHLISEKVIIDSISIHAPHTGRDSRCACTTRQSTLFQSTRPIRGATRSTGAYNIFDDISIHAPHTGRDSPHLRGFLPRQKHFNPRAPYGARHAE